MTNAESVCGSCDCADPTTMAALRMECTCGCHGRRKSRKPAAVNHEAPGHDATQCATCAAIDPHMTEEGSAGVKPGPFPLKMDCGVMCDQYVIVTAQGCHYATTYDPGASRMIQAAPDLLAALKRTVAICEKAKSDEGVDLTDLFESMTKIENIAYAAIKKAGQEG